MHVKNCEKYKKNMVFGGYCTKNIWGHLDTGYLVKHTVRVKYKLYKKSCLFFFKDTFF